MKHEVFISVDVEASGPVPGEYSLLSLGACLVDKPDVAFYVQLKPITEKADAEALRVNGLSLAELSLNGQTPTEAMRGFQEWVNTICDDGNPVFVGFNAAFDWAYVNYYFHRFLGANPFGFAALDIKSLYMGVFGSTWGGTKSSEVAKALGVNHSVSHHALDDARYQARLFSLLVGRARSSMR